MSDGSEGLTLIATCPRARPPGARQMNRPRPTSSSDLFMERSSRCQNRILQTTLSQREQYQFSDQFRSCGLQRSSIGCGSQSLGDLLEMGGLVGVAAAPARG